MIAKSISVFLRIWAEERGKNGSHRKKKRKKKKGRKKEKKERRKTRVKMTRDKDKKKDLVGGVISERQLVKNQR